MYKLIEKNNLLTLHIMVIVLGFTGILGKLITSINTLHLVWYRMFIAFIVLALFLYFKKQLFSISRKDFISLIGIGIIVGLHWIFFFESIKVSTVSVAVICLSTSSLFSAFLEPIFFKRKILIYEVLFSIIVIIALTYVLDADIKYRIGYIYGIVSAFLATLFTLLNAKFINKMDASKITMIEMLGGVFLITCILIFQTDSSLIKIPSLQDFWYLLILSVICTAGVFVWMLEIMKYITPYSLIMAVNLEPIYSIVLALLIFGESEYMGASFYIGSGIILLVVFVESYLKIKKK